MPTTILLRDVIASDLPIFFEQQFDPVANQMAAFPARDREAFMAHWVKILADENEHPQDHPLRWTGGRQHRELGAARQGSEQEVGYWLGREYWGKGIATQALSAFLEHVTTRPLYAHVVKHNIASIRVLAKCGFTITSEEGEEVILILRE